MFCVDDLSQLVLQGPYLSAKEKTLSIRVRRCQGRDYCKSEEEIDDFIDNHMVTFIRNDEKYDPHSYGDATI